MLTEVGASFGYNQMEGPEQYLSGPAAIRLLIDVCSQGGNLLLNVGPDEAGNIPEMQVQCLEYMASYMDVNASAIHGSTELGPEWAEPLGAEEVKDEEPWVRWTRSADHVFAFVDGKGKVMLPINASKVDLDSAKLLNGDSVTIDGGQVDLDSVSSSLRPVCIQFELP